MYTIEYNNDAGWNDDGFSQWWEVLFDGIMICKCDSEGEAKALIEKLNNFDELIKALKECKHWHQGDKWRGSPDCDQRGAWNRQMDIIDNALRLAEGG